MSNRVRSAISKASSSPSSATPSAAPPPPPSTASAQLANPSPRSYHAAAPSPLQVNFLPSNSASGARGGSASPGELSPGAPRKPWGSNRSEPPTRGSSGVSTARPLSGGSQRQVGLHSFMCNGNGNFVFCRDPAHQLGLTAQCRSHSFMCNRNGNGNMHCASVLC